MLAMDDTGALLRFVQRSNDIDLREGEAALRARGRYSELVALYQHRGQHEAALELLHTLTSSPQDLPIPPSGVVHHHCQCFANMSQVWKDLNLSFYVLCAYFRHCLGS